MMRWVLRNEYKDRGSERDRYGEKKKRIFILNDYKKEKEMVIVLLSDFKQTQDFTSFPRQANIEHQSKLNSYFKALQYHSLLGADYK